MACACDGDFHQHDLGLHDIEAFVCPILLLGHDNADVEQLLVEVLRQVRLEGITSFNYCSCAASVRGAFANSPISSWM